MTDFHWTHSTSLHRSNQTWNSGVGKYPMKNTECPYVFSNTKHITGEV